jgi:hypothetical protein
MRLNKIPWLIFTTLTSATMSLANPALAQHYLGIDCDYSDDADDDGICDVIRPRSYSSPQMPTYPEEPIITFAAYAHSEKVGFAAAWGFSSQAEAEATALRQCGASDCKIVMWFNNVFAAATQADDGAWGSGSATNRGEAEQAATRECRKYSKIPNTCTLKFSMFSDGS